MTYHRVSNVIIITVWTRRERGSRGRGECIMHLTGDASVASAAGEAEYLTTRVHLNA